MHCTTVVAVYAKHFCFSQNENTARYYLTVSFITNYFTKFFVQLLSVLLTKTRKSLQ